MLSEEQLREIGERANKATPGPWRDDVYVFECGVFEEGDYERGLSRKIPIGKCDDCGKGPLLATIVREGTTFHRHMREPTEDYQFDWRSIFSASNGTEICGNYDYEEGGVASTKEDADFISHARQDIPDLLAHVAELEESLHPRGVPGTCAACRWFGFGWIESHRPPCGLSGKRVAPAGHCERYEAALEAARKEET
jgi:hypothetical protein